MDWISEPLDHLQWGLWHFLATVFWAVDRLVLMGAVLIHTLRKWITNPNGIIDLVMSSMLQGETAAGLKTFMAGAILLALLLAVFVFILRPLIGQGHSPVDLRKVFLWLAFAGYLFSTGGAFFSSLEGFRAQLSSSSYQVATSVNGSVDGAGYNNTQGEVPLNSSQPFSPTVQLFPNTTHVYPGSEEYTGIDVASAYLFATQEDVNGTNNGGTGLPAGFEAQYFTNDGASPWPSNYTADQRRAALNKAITGVIRAGTGIVPSIFAIQQAIIFLALALAAAIIIFSLPIALVFAFFTATEVITLSVVRAYIALLVKTYVTAMILAIFMGFLKFWADSQNWVAFLGMSLLISYFTFQLAHMAVQTITQSLNVVTQAIGQATGTHAVYFDPIKMAGQAAGLAATVGIAAATGGAGLAAGSLLSGAGEMGLSVPGMRTLGFGLAMRNRKPGQYAQDALQAANQPGGAASQSSHATPQQRINNYLQANGIPPIQPAAANVPSSSTAPPRTAPLTTILPANGTGTSMSPPSAPTAASGTQTLQTPPSQPGSNGAVSQSGQQHSYQQRNSPKSAVGPTQPSGSTRSNGAQASQVASQAPQHGQFVGAQNHPIGQEQVQVNTASDDAPDSHAPVLEGFAQMPSYVRVRTGSNRDATVASALTELVRSGEGAAVLPPPLLNLPSTTQAALLEMAGRGYRVEEVSAIADAVNTVISRLQLQNLPPTAVTRYFLGRDGYLDMNSRGVGEALRELGPIGSTWSSDPQRRADMAYIIGTSLQLEKTYHAGDIRSAVGRSVAEGGSVDSAADLLGVSPAAAWGGRYGSVQSAITRSPLFGLNNADDVQRFVVLAQQRPLDELVSGQPANLAPEQQALLDRVRARAAEIAASESGDSSDVAAQAVLSRYLRDVRNIPARITAPVVPVPAQITHVTQVSQMTPITQKSTTGEETQK